MENDFIIKETLGNGTRIVEMNDKSGFAFLYPDDRLSSGRFGEISKFDESGFASIKRVGESEVSYLLDRDGNIYTKKISCDAGDYEKNLERVASNNDYVAELKHQVNKKGCIKQFWLRLVWKKTLMILKI